MNMPEPKGVPSRWLPYLCLTRLGPWDGVSSYCYGRLKWSDQPFMYRGYYTMERRWDDNRRRLSCIPDGIYPIEIRKSSRRDGLVIWLTGVPNRSAIQIHPANHPHELAGCIAPGFNFRCDPPTVWPSAPAFKEILHRLRNIGSRSHIVISSFVRD